MLNITKEKEEHHRHDHVNSYLSGVYREFFIETKFTAELEAELDKIAEGSISWTDVLDKFWEELQNYLSKKIDGIPFFDLCDISIKNLP